VHIISRKALKEAARRYGGVEPGLDTWFRVASKAQWRSLDDVRKTYPSADGVKVKGKIYTVFNVGGNHFRLIAKIEYDYQKIFIKHVLTHAEYDKEAWKK
jgi:mRNA interferase HigB